MWAKMAWLFEKKEILFVVGIVELVYALVWLLLLFKRRARIRRKKYCRKIEYTLPERNNGYIRDRLQTALHIKEGEDVLYNREDMGVRLGYAKGLIKQLTGAALSAIEQSEVKEMAEILFVCAEKKDWSRKEFTTINDIFMRLLKLSAKYEIIS